MTKKVGMQDRMLGQREFHINKMSVRGRNSRPAVPATLAQSGKCHPPCIKTILLQHELSFTQET